MVFRFIVVNFTALFFCLMRLFRAVFHLPYGFYLDFTMFKGMLHLASLGYSRKQAEKIFRGLVDDELKEKN